MALSLALNWNLPASTPLFDEGSPLHATDQSQSSVTASPQADTNETTPSVTPSSSTSQSSLSESTPSPGAAPATNALARPTPSSAAGIRSYAAAASASSSPALPQAPVPSYRGVGLSSQPNYGGFGGAASPFSNGTWSAPFQPGTVPPAKAVVSEDGRRLRSTSGPQKPSHLTYNDTLQHYPGPLPGGHGRAGLPPGAMQPGTLPHAISNPSLSGSNGYHPYRRTVKGSDVSQPTSPFGQQPPVLTVPGSISQQVNMPQPPQRIRSSSTSSSGTAGETAKTRAAAPLATYSSVASGAIRPPPTVTASKQGRSSEPSRRGSTTSVEVGAGRPELGSTESFATAGSGVHSRTNSISSTSSSVERGQAPANAGSSNGRTTPVARKPLPSPLSRTNPVSDDDDGPATSDDENTIGGRTTPTPGDKQKKGLSGKLRKALSLSTLQQVEAAAAAPDRAYGGRANVATRRADGTPFPHSSLETNGSSGSTRSTSPPRTPDNGVPLPGSSAASISSRRSTRPPISGAEGGAKRSIFNRKFNSSTDNISISSTVSSASMMLRKVGNLGKLARRSNIMGLTNMFNKEKDDGRVGMHNDDFGTLPTSSDPDPNGGTKGKRDKSKAKKGAPAVASVSHATVELETSPNKGGDTSMTPAASYVRQHQIQMRAEAERLAREKAEAERQAAAAAAARVKMKTTDDVTESRQKMIEKEKERLKSKRGWRKRLVGSLGSSSEVQQATGLETMPLDESSADHHAPPVQVAGGYNVPAGATGAQPQLGNAANFNESSFDSAFDDDDLEPPHMPSAAEGYDSGDDFETDSLRHWGEGIERSRESAAKIKSVKSILKNIALNDDRSSPQQYGAPGTVEKPFAGRVRANSYDAPQASGQSTNSVPLMSQISTSASTDRVDGVPRQGDEDKPARSGSSEDRSRGGAATPTQTSNLGHHPNSSLPTLSLMLNPSPTGQRSMTAPTLRKRLTFADSHIYHSTWPAHVYDRRGELATCNRLTPLLAQRIKEELNTYKMEEMAVAPSSRIHTHFFV